MSTHLEDGQDMVGVVIRFEVDERRRVAEDAESSRGEGGALQAMRGVLAEDDSRRPCRLGKVIWHFVEKALNPHGRFQRSELAEFGSSEHWQGKTKSRNGWQRLATASRLWIN